MWSHLLDGTIEETVLRGDTRHQGTIMIVEIDDERLSADLLYDLQKVFLTVNAQSLASRLEMERRNVVIHGDDGYSPTFTLDELTGIGMTLLSIQQECTMSSRPIDRLEIDQFAKIVNDHLENVDVTVGTYSSKPGGIGALRVYSMLSGDGMASTESDCLVDGSTN